MITSSGKLYLIIRLFELAGPIADSVGSSADIAESAGQAMVFGLTDASSQPSTLESLTMLTWESIEFARR